MKNIICHYVESHAVKQKPAGWFAVMLQQQQLARQRVLYAFVDNAANVAAADRQ